MNLNRRLVLQSASGFAVAALPILATAQAKEPEADFAYKVLSPVQPTDAPPGKVEVIEFFWYGCPHCYAFEPVLAPWVDKLPAHISFKRVPAVFNDNWFVHAKLFYTLEAMGALGKLHKKVFDDIHGDKKSLNTEAEIVDWAAANGLDKKKFSDTLRSFGVQGKASRARQIANAYKIDGVPAMAVAGKYTTANTMPAVNSHQGVLPIVDFLVAKERK